ncbi:MAG: hypothetical protein JWN41_828 [Thermoleophilia bacterium]|nr:hypothetical protein [Thermoleophilia bacterium]
MADSQKPPTDLAEARHDPVSATRRPPLRVHLPHAATVDGPRAIWAAEALLARVRVTAWELAATAATADITFAHDTVAWQFAWDREPDSASDPLAFTFWWLARVEELLAPAEAFDAHGRFRYVSSALARRGDPLATPVDDLAARLDIGAAFVAQHVAARPAWSIVATHDIDLTWRWTARGVRRAIKDLVRNVRSRRIGAAALELAALLAVPYWRLRKDDPWCNAHRIRRLEANAGARSTSYVLTDFHALEDGDVDAHELGRDRYIARLVEGTQRITRKRRRGTTHATTSRPAGGGTVGLHGSYTASVTPGRVADERRQLEALAGGTVHDHRYHYLRYRPTDAWPQLDAAGITSDATLGYAEQPGFRAGTAHPYRAWHHAEGRALELVVLPLAFMDASLDARHLDLDLRADGAELLDRVVDTVRRVGGSASVLIHNDRLCTVENVAWTRLYRRLLVRVRQQGGVAHTAREAANGYLASIPVWRRER